MNLLALLRERTRLVIGTAVVASMFLACGALAILYLSPQQALLARRIERMPAVDAAAIDAAQAGTELLVTGHLQGNQSLDQGSFVAYTQQEWVVTPPAPDDEDGTAKGSWKTGAPVVPDLTLSVGGQTVRILHAQNVRMSGPLREVLRYSDNLQQAKYEDEWLPLFHA